MKSIATALASAQINMGKALKQANNPHFRSKYADLGSVMDACLPALNERGIAVIQDVVYYKVKLKLEAMDQRLIPGMSADVDIKVSEKFDVIKISEQAVIREKGNVYVEVIQSDGKTKKVKIETGTSGD